MPEYDPQSALAVGNDNIPGLTLISAITVSGVALLPPLTRLMYSRGETRYKANSVPYITGKATKQWLSFLQADQYTYVRDTYSGLVTVHGWLEGTVEFDFNASLSFEEVVNYDGINVAEEDYGWSIPNVKWMFTDVVVIPDA